MITRKDFRIDILTGHEPGKEIVSAGLIIGSQVVRPAGEPKEDRQRVIDDLQAGGMNMLYNGVREKLCAIRRLIESSQNAEARSAINRLLIDLE